MLRILKQIFREFSLPFIIAIAWTGYVVGFHGKLTEYVSNFAGSFFLTSWATGQINRIRREQHVKDSFASLRHQLDALNISVIRWTNAFVKLNTQPPNQSSSIGNVAPPVSQTPAMDDENKVTSLSPLLVQRRRQRELALELLLEIELEQALERDWNLPLAA
jgi:hypothetical protein